MRYDVTDANRIHTRNVYIALFGVAIMFIAVVAYTTSRENPQNVPYSFTNPNTSRDQVAAVSSGRIIHPVMIHGIPLITDVPFDSIEPLYNPEFESNNNASVWLPKAALVIGVELNGDARAYPITAMRQHELVNDSVGMREILVSYNPITHTSIVFDRRIGPNVFAFRNTGALYDRSTVMYDEETSSYWQQSSGKAISGTQIGTTLTLLPSTVTTYEKWLAAHPGTLVLSPLDLSVPTSSFLMSERLEESPNELPISHIDKRLSFNEKVVGVIVGGQQKAYPIDRIGTRTIKEKLGGKLIEIRGDGVSAQVYFDVHGSHISAPQTTTTWGAWSAAYPQTLLYTGTNEQ